MFKLLLVLYTLFNIIALIILLISLVSTVITNIKLHKLPTSKIGLPSFADCKSSFVKCCVTSSLFLLIDWILFSSTFVTDSGTSGKEILAKFTVIFATIWAVMILIVLLLEIAMKFLKNNKVQMKDAFGPLIVRTLWYFILVFIIV